MSNFIFARRDLQAAINRLATAISGSQIADLVTRLNRAGPDRLPAMWELVVLDACTAVGALAHEAPLSDGRRPDVRLVLDDSAQTELVGDIRTISDAGLDSQNPVEDLAEELYRLARKAGLDPNRFGYDVQGDREGPYRNARMKLHLPPRPRLLELMREVVPPWLKDVASAPATKSKRVFSAPDAAFTLSYDPAQRYASGGYLSYDVAASKTKNPLFTALKDKRRQLKAVDPGVLRVIIACDGGCSLMTSSPHGRAPGTFSAGEVVRDFLRQNSSIDAVLLIAVDQMTRPLTVRPDYRLKFDLIARAVARSAEAGAGLVNFEAAVKRMAAKFPAPRQSADNAARRCLEPGPGFDGIGGWEMAGDTISISSRALLRLLAGAISAEDFREAHGWTEEDGRNDLFAKALQRGETITAAEIKPGQDDDWLALTLAWDPASGPFKVR